MIKCLVLLLYFMRKFKTRKPMAFISDDDERVCSSIRERDNSYSYAHRRQQEKKKQKKKKKTMTTTTTNSNLLLLFFYQKRSQQVVQFN